MLYSLSIKNVALIDNASITLEDGFNVLSGETGAGKSIVVDSLNLLLGDRTDRDLVRTGTDMAQIEGVFFVSSAVAESVCRELDVELEEDNMLLVRRSVTSDGRSTVKVNGRTVTVSALRRGMQYVVDIYGQHEHQALLKKENHIVFLDNYAADDISVEKNECQKCYEQYISVRNKLNADWGSEAERERRMDILRFQIEEIASAELYDSEEEELAKRKKFLQSIELIAETLQQVHYSLNDDGGVCEALSESAKSMERIADKDDYYNTLAERLRSLSYDAQDISEEVSSCLDGVDGSEGELDKVEARLQLIRDLKRKYGADVAAVLAFMEEARKELDRLEHAEVTVAELEKALKKAKAALNNACEQLSSKRKKAAEKLEKELSRELKELGMRSAEFKISFERLNDPEFAADGFDVVEFLFSANLGEPLKPLVKVISGGEMSRFMLAVKSILADNDNIGTMVFDEIDTGISGRMAQVTAEKMARIAHRHQVICVTHLPQIAAMASAHFYIKKNERDGSTRTTLELLKGEGRASEIARLSGGDTTSIAVAHAKEMLKSAQDFRDSLN